MKFAVMKAYPSGEQTAGEKGYFFEPKLDGYRALCYKNSGLKFITANGRDITAEYPELDFLVGIKAKECVLDGEIVVFDKKGNPDFGMMQSHSKGATYVVFDILSLNRENITSLPLFKRKKILERTVKETGGLQKIAYTGNGEKLLGIAKKRKLEGIIAKRKDSIYEQKRSRLWLKIKLHKTMDCVIMGYTTEKRNISALLIGAYKNRKLIALGKVGTGFSESALEGLETKFKKIKGKALFESKEKITWLKPRLVCEVRYHEFTGDALRAPVFLRLRTDKNPEDCILEEQV
jgi:bifunctional non-homologous end joining protein LigD